jgi:hypothetical protein
MADLPGAGAGSLVPLGRTATVDRTPNGLVLRTPLGRTEVGA